MVIPRDSRYGEGSVAVWTQSSLETFLRCGFRYRFEYLVGRLRRVTQAMAVGTGVGAGAECDLTAKAAMIQAPKPKEIVDAAVAGYDAELSAADHDLGQVAVGAGRDETARGSMCYSMDVAPLYARVVSSEQPLAADFQGWRLIGTPDVVTPDGVGDLKTGRSWSPGQVFASRQLTAYSILHQAHYGNYPRRVWIDSMSHRGGKWTAKRIESYRSDADAKAFVVVAESALEAIQAGVFLPAPEGAWWCSAKWCPHHRYCPAFSGRQEDE